MKVINVTIGTKTINDDGKVISIKGDYNGNGRCYKDLDAWNNSTNKFDIIFASEGDLDLLDLGADCCCWTKEGWINYVRNYLIDNDYSNYCTEEFVHYLAEHILYACDWQELSTKLLDIDIEGEYEYHNN